MLHTSASALLVAFALCACAASHDTSVGQTRTTSAVAPPARGACISDEDTACMMDSDCCSFRCEDARCVRNEP